MDRGQRRRARASTSAWRSTCSPTRATSPGRRTAAAYRIEIVRPYREADDQAEIDPDECPTSSRPRPDLVPTLTSTPILDLVPSSPPKGTRDEDEVDLVPSSRPYLVLRPFGVDVRTSPLPGDDGFLEALYRAFEAAAITDAEWLGLSAVHLKLAGAPTA